MQRIIVSILLGLGVGAALGLYIGWVLSPVQYVQSPMASLSQHYKDEYTVMVASAYQVDGDINEAVRRLQPLGISNIPQYVRDVTERYISESGTGKEADIRTLVGLSCELGYCTAPMQAFTLPTAVPTTKP
ncbi:MAG: hypothetical protein ABI947_01825 [Chloroflexota bacterium]